MIINNKLKTNVTFDNEVNSKIKSKDNQASQGYNQPLIAMFTLLLEWDIENVQEKERKSKNLSTPS